MKATPAGEIKRLTEENRALRAALQDQGVSILLLETSENDLRRVVEETRNRLAHTQDELEKSQAANTGLREYAEILGDIVKTSQSLLEAYEEIEERRKFNGGEFLAIVNGRVQRMPWEVDRPHLRKVLEADGLDDDEISERLRERG